MTKAVDPTAVVHQVARLVENRTHQLRHIVGSEKWPLELTSFLPEGLREWIARRFFRLDQG